MNGRRILVSMILVTAVALAAALPAVAGTVTKTFPATLDYPHGNRPGHETDCYATVFGRWADVPNTQYVTLNYVFQGTATSKGSVPPFHDNYPFYSDPPPFALKVPAGSHWVNLAYGSASGYDVPGTECSDQDQKFKQWFTGPATATITYTEPDNPNPNPGGTDGIATAIFAGLSVKGTAARIGTLLTQGFYTTSFNAPGPGKAKLSWYQVPKGAKVSAKKKPVLVASGSKRAKKAGKIKIKIRLTKKGKRLLKRVHKGKRIKLTGKGTFTPTGQKGRSTKRKFKLKR